MKKFYYLIRFQYLGFRYHGWQKQPHLKTVEMMISKTAEYVLGHSNFTVLGCSRTDSKVSANHSAFELFIRHKLDKIKFIEEFNDNLPNDIRILSITEVDKSFSIINAPRKKEYIYLFSCGGKAHPFCASILSSFPEKLDIELMKKGALLFEGKHNFKRYCTKPGDNTKFEREVLLSKIEENNTFKANFFPKTSYAYHVHSKGFLRYQARLIMGQLLSLGRGEISLDEIIKSLNGEITTPLRYIAPASGLILNNIDFLQTEKP